MILVTVGSTMFPFSRMTSLVERLARQAPPSERIIFQYGCIRPKTNNIHIDPYPFLDHAKLMTYMKKASHIICHGGPATIYQSLSFGKIPWVLPRQERYGEHLNDHQKDFARFMASHNLIHILTPQTSLSHIYAIDTSISPIRKHNAILTTYLHSLTRSSV